MRTLSPYETFTATVDELGSLLDVHCTYPQTLARLAERYRMRAAAGPVPLETVLALAGRLYAAADRAGVEWGVADVDFRSRVAFPA